MGKQNTLFHSTLFLFSHEDSKIKDIINATK